MSHKHLYCNEELCGFMTVNDEDGKKELEDHEKAHFVESLKELIDSDMDFDEHPHCFYKKYLEEA